MKVIKIIESILVSCVALFSIVNAITMLFKGTNTNSFAFIGNLILSGIIIVFVIFQCFRKNKAPKYQLNKRYKKYLAMNPTYLDKLEHGKVVELSRKTELAIKEAGKSKNLRMDVYYVLLFALFETAKKEILAVSIMNDTEWTDTLEEIEFLDVNLNVANHEVHLKRIFIVERENEKEMLTSAHRIKKLIEANNQYIHLYLVYKEKLKKALLQTIEPGFVVFDDFVVARDDFWNNEARGYLLFDESEIQNNKKMYLALEECELKRLDMDLYNSICSTEN